MNDHLKLLIVENNKTALQNMYPKKIRPWEYIFNCVGCAKRLNFYDVMNEEYKKGLCYCENCQNV